jgi:hypothetical protein
MRFCASNGHEIEVSYSQRLKEVRRRKLIPTYRASFNSILVMRKIVGGPVPSSRSRKKGEEVKRKR